MRRSVATLLAIAATLMADGGTVILRQNAGPLSISVFSAAEQLRAGRNNVSVMVQNASSKSVIPDAKVSVHLTQSSSSGIAEVFAPATHEKATNKLLYATPVDISATGTWRLTINVSSSAGNAEVAGNVSVLPPQPPVAKYWPYFAMLPVLLGLLLLNRRLRRRQISARQPARP